MTDVVFEDHAAAYAAAYAKMERLFADEPENMSRIKPVDRPESFLARMRDQAAVRNVRDSTIHDELKALPGVFDVVIRCTTVDECKEGIRRMKAPTPAVS